jgi:hypothetical protein
MIERRVSDAVGKPVRALRRVQTRGYALAFHAIAEFDDGSTAFVKAGAEELTSGFLRDELRFYESVGGFFMPRLLGYDAGDPPLLVLEDLSDGRWPPPWDGTAIAPTEAPCWSTGTGCTEAIPTSILPRGRRRFIWRADHRPSNFSPAAVRWEQPSPASSAREPACRCRRPPGASAKCSAHSWRWRSRGRVANWD